MCSVAKKVGASEIIQNIMINEILGVCSGTPIESYSSQTNAFETLLLTAFIPATKLSDHERQSSNDQVVRC